MIVLVLSIGVLLVWHDIIFHRVCVKCKQPRDAYKRIEIWKLPPILLIHLKRYGAIGMLLFCLLSSFLLVSSIFATYTTIGFHLKVCGERSDRTLWTLKGMWRCKRLNCWLMIFRSKPFCNVIWSYTWITNEIKACVAQNPRYVIICDWCQTF